MQEFECNTRIMGTTLSISIITDDESRADNLFHESLRRLSSYESEFSRFIPTSTLSQLNTFKTMTVSPLFIEVLSLAKKLTLKTDGYFNPLFQIKRKGYTTTFDSLSPEIQATNSEIYNTDIKDVLINAENNSITLLQGQKLDFGGFLKGFLAEKEAVTIKNASALIQGVIVNIGGDIHTQGRDATGNQFVFSIQNPVRGDSFSVPLENMSLATSGTYKRAWNIDTKDIHHILGHTGIENPETNIISASIIHRHGAYAEAYAKMLFSLEPNACMEKIHEELQYLTINTEGIIQTSL